MMMFDGKPLIVHKGGTSRRDGQTATADTRLFHIKSSVGGRCRAVEVDATASNLNSNDSFLLLTPRDSYSWIGAGLIPTIDNVIKLLILCKFVRCI